MRNLLFLLLLPLFFACRPQQSKQQTFSKEGVSFVIPEGWSITEEQDLDGKGHYLSCEKKGSNASGLLVLTWINDSVDLDDMMQQCINNMKEGVPGKTPFQAGEPRQADYAGHQARNIAYSMSIMGIPHQGQVYAFYASGKSILIMAQEALEDAADNAKGFKVLRETFKCE